MALCLLAACTSVDEGSGEPPMPIGDGCDDGVACTRDSLGADGQGCVFTPDNSRCDDGIFCDGVEQCDAQQGCVAGTAPVVDDGVDCTVDSCDELGRQVRHEPNDAACDDALDCTADRCDANAGCVREGDDAACDDGLFCNGAERCDDEQGCVAGELPESDDGIDCTVARCDEASRSIAQVPDDAACDDSLFCNGAERCDAASGCVEGEPPLLDDGVDCTSDSCNEEADAVVHATDDAACDDGAFCNGVEVCDPLAGCRAGAAPEVDDGIACTRDSCDEDADAVVHAADDATCDDGLFCNGVERCDAEAGCGPGAALVVEDGVDCTLARCDEAADAIVQLPLDARCDDGNPCNGVERCDLTGGCESTPRAADGSSCDTDAEDCVEATCQAGACVQTPRPDCASCGLGLCASGVCRGLRSVDVFEGFDRGQRLLDALEHPFATDLQRRWVRDEAQHHRGGGAARSGIAEPGDPSWLQTEVTLVEAGELRFFYRTQIDAQWGVLRVLVDGEERDRLTGSQPFTEARYALSAGHHVLRWSLERELLRSGPEPDTAWVDSVVVSGIAPRVCDDDQSCTLDFVGDGDSCLHCELPDGRACDSGDACLEGGRCAAGACEGGRARICDDGTLCNGAETCDSALGCLPGFAPMVDDEVPCTLDLCQPLSGAVSHIPQDGLCGDGDVCNGAERCDPELGCLSDAPAPDGTDCGTDDNDNGCSVSICEAGRCVTRATEACLPCGEQGLCDGEGRCIGGEAAPGTTCDDGESCTLDRENPDTGACLHCNALDGQSCGSDDPCTAGTCERGVCAGDTLPPGARCDDGNPCTDGGRCNGTCESAPLPAGTPCGDGNACEVATCDGAGQCVRVPAPDCEACPEGLCAGGECVAPEGGGAVEDFEDGTLPADWFHVDGPPWQPVRTDAFSGQFALSPVEVQPGIFSVLHVPLEVEQDSTLRFHWRVLNAPELVDFIVAPDLGEITELLVGGGGPGADAWQEAFVAVEPGVRGVDIVFGSDWAPGQPTPQPFIDFVRLPGAAPSRCGDSSACQVAVDGPGGCVFCPALPGSGCRPGNPCSSGQGICDDAGACLAAPLPDFQPCGEDLAFCESGVCVEHPECDDGNPCTEDAFFEGECVHAPADPGARCDDALFCNGIEFCNELGDCVSDGPPTLGAVPACVEARCDESQAAIVPIPIDARCDDGDPCSIDRCSPELGCQHVPLRCDDRDSCTADSCVDRDGQPACVFEPGPDGELCSADALGEPRECEQRTCSAGVCVAGEGPDDVPCSDDRNACTADVCRGGGCAHPPLPAGTPCEAGDPCEVGSCDGRGRCVIAPREDGAFCGTSEDGCSNGVCRGGACVFEAAPSCTVCTLPEIGETFCAGGTCGGLGGNLEEGFEQGFPAERWFTPFEEHWRVEVDPTPDGAFEGTAFLQGPRVEPLVIGPAVDFFETLASPGTLRFWYRTEGVDATDPQSAVPIVRLQSGAFFLETALPPAGSPPPPGEPAPPTMGPWVQFEARVPPGQLQVSWFVRGAPVEAAALGSLRIDALSLSGLPSGCDDGSVCTLDLFDGQRCLSCDLPDHLPCDGDNPCASAGECRGGDCVGAPFSAGTPCEVDEDPCTVGSCDGAGSCALSPAPEGTECGGDNPCVIGRCDAAGQCDTQLAPAGTGCGEFGDCAVGSCDDQGRCVGAAAPDCTPCGDDAVCVAGSCRIPTLFADGFESGQIASPPWDLLGTGAFEARRTDAVEGLFAAELVNFDPGVFRALVFDVETEGPAVLSFWYRGDGAQGGENLLVIESLAAPPVEVFWVPGPAWQNLQQPLVPGFNQVVFIATTDPGFRFWIDDVQVIPEDGSVDALCDDGNPCTRGIEVTDGVCLQCPDDGSSCGSDDPCAAGPGECIDGGCAVPTLNDGAPCDADGNVCTDGDQCIAGECVPGDMLDCDDGDPCTVELCDPQEGCVREAFDCSDGIACTLDRCVDDGGVPRCENTVIAQGDPCDDGNACTVATVCVDGACIGVPAQCDDGQFCNGVEACDPEIGCVPGTPPFIDDGLDCTFDDCDESSDAITHDAIDARCDNGLSCDGVERCDRVFGCVVGAPAPDGTDCSASDDPCRVGRCQGGSCELQPAPDCTECDGGEGACLEGFCLRTDGEFVFVRNFDDPSAPTSLLPSPVPGRGFERIEVPPEEAHSGIGILQSFVLDPAPQPLTAIFETPPLASAHITLWARLADPGASPVSVDFFFENGAGAPWQIDGTWRRMEIDTGADFTGEGRLVVGRQNASSADVPLWLDTLEMASVGGGCDEGSACSAGFAFRELPECLVCDRPEGASCGGECLGDGQCRGGVCEGDALPSGEPCRDDGNPCTADVCDGSGVCAHEPVDAGTPCDDGDSCSTNDACDPGGSCFGEPVDCDDGVFCNGAEQCEPGAGCVAGLPPAGSDGLFCTVDTCVELSRSFSHQPDDRRCSNPCADSGGCDPVLDCLATPFPDGANCTVDEDGCRLGTCQGGFCFDHAPQDCRPCAVSEGVCAGGACGGLRTDDFLEAFEAPLGNQWVTGGDFPWKLDDSEAFSGMGSYVSGSPAAGQQSILQLSLQLPQGGTLTWYDRLQLRPGASGAVAGLAFQAQFQHVLQSSTDWEQRSVTLPPGASDVAWVFFAQGAPASELEPGLGFYWIDDVEVVPFGDLSCPPLAPDSCEGNFPGAGDCVVCPLPDGSACEGGACFGGSCQ